MCVLLLAGFGGNIARVAMFPVSTTVTFRQCSCYILGMYVNLHKF